MNPAILSPPPPFIGDADHLKAELDLLDLLLWREVRRAREATAGDSAVRGLFVSDDDVVELFSRPRGEPLWSRVPVHEDLAALCRAHASQSAFIADRIAASESCGRLLKLQTARRLANLDEVEGRIVLLALCPELDLAYERIFGWLHDDVRRRRPSVGLAVDLFSSGLQGRLNARKRFAPDAPLVQSGLLRVIDPQPGNNTPLLRHELVPSPGILDWLAGRAPIDARWRHLVLRKPPGAAETWIVSPTMRQRARRVAAQTAGLISVVGLPGSGRRAFAREVCQARGQVLYVVQCRLIDALDLTVFIQLLDDLFCACRLEQSAVCFADIESVDVEGLHRQVLLQRMASSGLELMFVTHSSTWILHDPPSGLPPVQEVRLAIPHRNDRLELWRRTLPESDEEEIANAATVFRFPPGRILAASATARGIALSDGRDIPDCQDVMRASRLQATPRLGSLATQISTHHTWEDLILPEQRYAQLRNIATRIRYQERVLEEWGFEKQLSNARGISALFSGPPGTGKTMAAAILAREVGRNLFRIDLSQVVSKYIGETEKQLERIFEEAESTDVALFFDEADALFGKRSGVRDARDRYANIEVSYLLQRLEIYPGLVILASNLRKNMDEAFVRRLSSVIDFPKPDRLHRELIWGSIWPVHAPVDPSVDPILLAKRFEVSGGHIRNIALSAAYEAASHESAITLAHVLESARAQYRSMGRILNNSLFELP